MVDIWSLEAFVATYLLISENMCMQSWFPMYAALTVYQVATPGYEELIENL